MMKPVILVCRYAFGLAGLLALALAVSVHAATIAGIDVEARYPSVWLFHYGIFPLVLAAVLVVFSLAPGARFRDVVLLIPMTARILIVAVFTYAVANFFVIMPLSGAGDPMVRDGRFFLSDHGTLREVSEEQFHAQRSLALRGFSGHWVFLYLVSTVYLLLARAQGK